MAMSIVNNPISIGAQGGVNSINNKLSKTIKSLSTGLRINTAADDASGLAVSEKLRTQINGLAKAATNAQDAISMLQTAEGAMGSMNDMLQRMRELAVQAGDPAYTANDRAMLQLEVDELKEEINRVSSSTEFNTKKLLNGDAAGLWTSSTDNVEAIFTGSPVEGNYKVSYDVEPGTNAVYKSNIMRIGKGEMSYDIKGNGTSITEIDNINGMLRGEDLKVTVGGMDGTNATAVLTGGTGVLGDAGSIELDAIATASAAVTGNNSYSIEFETIGKKSAGASGQIRFRVMNTKTGELSDWVTATVNDDGTIQNVSAIETNLAGIPGRIFATAGATFGMRLEWDGGEKALVNVAGAKTTVTGSGTIKVGSNGSTLIVTAGMTSEDRKTTHTIHTAQMDEAGNIYYGKMDITLNQGKTPTTGTATIDILGEGDIASTYTKLSQLEQFTNSDGRMILDNTQELSIYAGNGKQAKITLEGSDTIKDIEMKLNKALIEQLDMGADPANPQATAVNSSLVKFVQDPISGGNQAVKGTFVIQGAVLGDDSTLSFSGDDALLKALGVTKIQEESDSKLHVTVTDAHSGKFIGEDTVTDGRLRNVIPGVDLEIKPHSAAEVFVKNGNLVFQDKVGSEETFIHIVDNATKAAVGANEGQILDLSIPRLDTKSLEIKGITIATFEDSQKAITKLDKALERVSQTRATAGAQMNRLEYTMNNLNTTRENMTSAESRIRDLDIAQASSALSAQQVLLQSATAMLAQANQMPSYAMQLIQG